MRGNAIIADKLVKRYYSHERSGFFKKKKIVIEALKGVSFTVREGIVYGLLGPNGAGKTTTIKILVTLLLPDEGNARVAGYDVISEPEKVRENIGVTLSVEKGFFWKLTGRENLRYFGMLRGLKGKELEERIEWALRLVGLDKLGGGDKLYEEFSLGMKARLSLARALLADPPILILDEPTLGLDPHSARTIRNLLIKLAREEGKTVLVTTHNMHEAEMISDRLAIIDKGRIIAEGTVNELKKLVADDVGIVMHIEPPPGLDLNSLAYSLKSRLGIGEVSVLMPETGKSGIRILARHTEAEEVVAETIRFLGSSAAKVYRVEIQEPTLEDVFIRLTSSAR